MSVRSVDFSFGFVQSFCGHVAGEVVCQVATNGGGQVLGSAQAPRDMAEPAEEVSLSDWRILAGMPGSFLCTA